MIAVLFLWENWNCNGFSGPQLLGGYERIRGHSEQADTWGKLPAL